MERLQAIFQGETTYVIKKKKQQTKKHINLAWNIFEQKHWQ